MSDMRLIGFTPKKELVKIHLKDNEYTDPDIENNSILNYFMFDYKNEWVRDGVFDFKDKKFVYGFLLGENEIEINLAKNKSENSNKFKYKLTAYKINLDEKVIYVDKSDVYFT